MLIAARQVIPIRWKSNRCLLFGIALAVREIILNNMFGIINENEYEK